MLIAMNYENFLPTDSEKKKMFLDLWHDTIGDLEYEDAEQAYKAHLKESVYVPKIADIYQRVVSKNIPQFPDPVEEFNTVIRACSKYGQNRTSEAMESFHPYTRKVVEMNGGFRKFCMANTEDEISDRKHFTETYNRLIDREVKTIKAGGNSQIQLQHGSNNTLENKISGLIKKI